MKKILIILVLLVTSRTAWTQSYYVEYVIGDEDGKGALLINDTLSYWQETFFLGGNNDDIIKLSSDYKIFLVKKNKANFLYYSYKTFDRVFLITDSLHIMQWKLEKETKEILGFKCKSASTIFRGRKYTAYYTTKIPLSNGPWKFGGLPGLILQIISHDDRAFNFTATKILQKQIPTIQDIPAYEPQKFITWKQFQRIYEELCQAQISRIKANLKPGEMSQLLYLTREVIYPPINTGKGVRIE
ncbi:MAG: GLPGLI family protein [Raineya sp.]|nr:GLPGLI family protein [Raineya sp.]